MKFPILIGSKNRLNYPLRKWFKLPHVLFVEPQEVKAYSEAYRSDTKIVSLEKNEGGFGFLLNSMMKWTLDRGGRYFWFLDDDMLGLSKRETGKLRSLKTRAEQERALGSIEAIAEKHGLAQVMVSFAGHNWYFKDRFKSFVGSWGWMLNDAKAIKAVGGYEGERLSEFHDWEMSARLLTRGFNNACCYDYAFNHKMRGFSGGATSMENRQQRALRSAQFLGIKYPGVTRIIYHEKHGQPEVRFDWRKLKKKIRR